MAGNMCFVWKFHHHHHLHGVRPKRGEAKARLVLLMLGNFVHWIRLLFYSKRYVLMHLSYIKHALWLSPEKCGLLIWEQMAGLPENIAKHHGLRLNGWPMLLGIILSYLLEWNPFKRSSPIRLNLHSSTALLQYFEVQNI